MTLKKAALLSLIGTALMTVPLVWTFVFECPQCDAGLGSWCEAVFVIHLCFWLF
jgi:hypothetical protein